MNDRSYCILFLYWSWYKFMYQLLHCYNTRLKNSCNLTVPLNNTNFGTKSLIIRDIILLRKFNIYLLDLNNFISYKKFIKNILSCLLLICFYSKCYDMIFFLYFINYDYELSSSEFKHWLLYNFASMILFSYIYYVIKCILHFWYKLLLFLIEKIKKQCFGISYIHLKIA